jgi:hypothetical protein
MFIIYGNGLEWVGGFRAIASKQKLYWKTWLSLQTEGREVLGR